MSGASGKVLAAIQATPEAARGGLIGKVRDGDVVTICARTGKLGVAAEGIEQREVPADERDTHSHGVGRELFSAFRERASSAEDGASFFGDNE